MPKPTYSHEDENTGAMDRDAVVQGILKAISLKRLRPGMKIGEIELASAFGTNRTHIRQVLSHLGSRGLVTLVPNRGAFVSQPSSDEARAVFETRRILEKAAVAAAIDGLTAAKAREFERLTHSERVHVHHDRWDGLDSTADFHVAVASLCGNAVLVKFMEELALRTSLIIAQFEPIGSEDNCPDAHAIIASHILKRDKAAAIKAMDEHLIDMRQRLRLDGEAEKRADITGIFQDLGIVPLRRPKSSS